MRGRAMGDLYRTAAEASTEHVVPTRSISGRAAAGSWIMQRPRCHPPVHVMLPDMHRGGCGGGVTRKCFRWRQRRFLPSSCDTCVAEFLTTHARAPQDDEAIRGHWRSLHRGLCVFMVEIAARRPTRTAYRHALPSHPLCYKNSTEKWFMEIIFNKKRLLLSRQYTTRKQPHKTFIKHKSLSKFRLNWFFFHFVKILFSVPFLNLRLWPEYYQNSIDQCYTATVQIFAHHHSIACHNFFNKLILNCQSIRIKKTVVTGQWSKILNSLRKNNGSLATALRSHWQYS